VTADEPTLPTWLARLCVVCAAFLLFAVQPLAGQYLLPSLGGGSGMWTACLLFFQVWVLVGYVAAQGLTRLGRRLQIGIWGMLLIAALIVLPVVPRMNVVDGPPALSVLVALALGVGLPALVLAMVSPLTQSWMSRYTDAPYGLFAWSNAGSLLALVLFPFILEPLAPRTVLIQAWGWGFGGFAVLSIMLAFKTSWYEVEELTEEKNAPPMQVSWMLWAAVAVAILMITSRNLSQEIAPGPFTWVAPLAVYLLTFILSFGRPNWYLRPVMAGLLLVGWTVIFWLALPGDEQPIAVHLAAQLSVLFITGWICHAELHQLRPVAVRLTSFYTGLAAGGVIGGLAVAVIAPLIFERFWENLLVHVAAGTLFGWTCFMGDSRQLARRWVVALLMLALIWTAVAFTHLQRHRPLMGEVIARERNFFGVLTVVERSADGQRERLMLHGATVHGLEIDDAPALGYHGPGSGVAQALVALRPTGPLHIGVVGLGTGTMAAHARENDTLRFYEINPAVTAMAHTHFHYLNDHPVIPGDARLALAAEKARKYDLLVMDAFLGGTVPVHLLTLEAFEEYQRHLKRNGILAVNISNRRLNLATVVNAAAYQMKWFSRTIENQTKIKGERNSRWVLLTGDNELANVLEAKPVTNAGLSLWTDNYASLFDVWR